MKPQVENESAVQLFNRCAALLCLSKNDGLSPYLPEMAGITITLREIKHYVKFAAKGGSGLDRRDRLSRLLEMFFTILAKPGLSAAERSII